MQKLWSNISFSDWSTKWIGALGKNRILPSKLVAQFETLENYFNAQALTLQHIANTRVGGFFTMTAIEGLPIAVQECLKRFIYYGVDGLLYNGTVAEEQVVAYQSSSISGRTDTTSGLTALNSLDFLSTKAIDAWNLSGIESRWKLWLKQNGGNVEAPLLDLKKFYTKSEVDLIVAGLSLESSLIDERITNEVTTLNNYINDKVTYLETRDDTNYADLEKNKVSYQNATRVNDTTDGSTKLIRNMKFTGSLERTTFSDTGITVEDGTTLYDAEIYTSTDVANLSAIVVDNIDAPVDSTNPALQASSLRLVKNLKENVDLNSDFISNQKYWLDGQQLTVPIEVNMPDGWKNLTPNGQNVSIFSGKLRNDDVLTIAPPWIFGPGENDLAFLGIYLKVPDKYNNSLCKFDIYIADPKTSLPLHSFTVDLKMKFTMNLPNGIAPISVSWSFLSKIDSMGNSYSGAVFHIMPVDLSKLYPLTILVSEIQQIIPQNVWVFDPDNKINLESTQNFETIQTNANAFKTELSNANLEQKEALITKITNFTDAKTAITQLQEELTKLQATPDKTGDINVKIATMANEINNLKKYKEYMLSTPYGEENFESWLLDQQALGNEANKRKIEDSNVDENLVAVFDSLKKLGGQ